MTYREKIQLDYKIREELKKNGGDMNAAAKKFKVPVNEVRMIRRNQLLEEKNERINKTV